MWLQSYQRSKTLGLSKKNKEQKESEKRKCYCYSLIGCTKRKDRENRFVCKKRTLTVFCCHCTLLLIILLRIQSLNFFFILREPFWTRIAPFLVRISYLCSQCLLNFFVAFIYFPNSSTLLFSFSHSILHGFKWCASSFLQCFSFPVQLWILCKIFL